MEFVRVIVSVEVPLARIGFGENAFVTTGPTMAVTGSEISDVLFDASVAVALM